jgi:hypothetical protein
MKASLIEMTAALIKAGIEVCMTKIVPLNCMRLGCEEAIWFYSTLGYGDGHCKHATACKCNINHRYYQL